MRFLFLTFFSLGDVRFKISVALRCLAFVSSLKAFSRRAKSQTKMFPTKIKVRENRQQTVITLNPFVS